jgi:predicted PurR-regulated permease PerM
VNSSSSTVNALLIAAILVATMYFAREVFIPLALAGIFSFMLAPPVRWLQQAKLPRPVAVIAVVAIAFAAIFALGRVMTNEVSQLAADLPSYQATLSEKIKFFRGGGKGTLEKAQDVLEKLNKELEGSQQAPSLQTPGLETPSLQTPTAPGVVRDRVLVPVEVHDPPGGPLQTLGALMSPLLSPLATTTLIIVFVMFMLIQKEDLRDRLIRLAGSADIPQMTATIDDTAHRLSHLFLTQLAINTGFGVCVALGLWWIGIPSPFIWGVLAGILRFVPFIGPVLGLIFPLILAISVGKGWSMALWTLALFVGLEGVTGQVVEPVFEGRTTGLTPVAIVVAATFWAWLWGPVGLVLATPLTVILVVLGRHFEALKFFDVLFGDEPALTESEVLYQRMLARDPVEATEHAKTFIGAHSLSHYCDVVARPALKLAQKDAERGALDPSAVEMLRGTVKHLFDDIAHEHKILRMETRSLSGGRAGSLPIVDREKLASHWQAEGPLVSIGVRSHLDEAAAEVIAALARTHGIDARVEKIGALSASEIANLDLSGAALVCLSCLDTKSEAHIRYAARRVRSKAPHAKLLLGLWYGADEEDLESLKEASGVDYAVRTFHEAAVIVLGEATTAPAPQSTAA